MSSKFGKTERVLSLMNYLLYADIPKTAKEIRTLEVYERSSVNDESFRKNLSRDIKSLQEAGIEVVIGSKTHAFSGHEARESSTKAGDNKKSGVENTYIIKKKDYYLKDVGLSDSELLALSIALKIAHVEQSDLDTAIWKLGGAAIDKNSELTRVISVDYPDNCGVLLEGLSEGRYCHFTYNAKQRCIEPWQVRFEEGNWYFLGFDTDAGESRRFRTDRIDGSVSTGRKVKNPTPREPDELMASWEIKGELEDEEIAKIWVSDEHSSWAKRLLGSDAVADSSYESNGQHGVLFELQVGNLQGLRSLLLEFGPDAELIAPEALRQDFVAWIERQAQ